jgi:glycosyltransferase involved in cell wall biosynthesis
MSRPLVSIAVPTWNRCEMLRTTLASAQAQTYAPLEIVVSDNASDDGTAEMVRELARDDERIRLSVSDTNIGTYNYLRVLQLVRGEYVKFLNSDDLLLPSAVERMAAPLDDPAVGLSIARQILMDVQGRALPAELSPALLGPTSGILSGTDVGDLSLVHTKNAFGCPSAHLFRRADVDAATFGMLARRRYRVAGDVAYCLALSAGRQVAYTAEGVVRIRVHDGQDYADPALRATDALDWLDLITVAPDFGFLADPGLRRRALTTATHRLVTLPELGATGDLARQVADGLVRAGGQLRVLSEAPLALVADDDRVIVEPDWASPAALREVVAMWIAEAAGMSQDELVLLVDPNMHAVDGALAQLETLLAELGSDPATVPNITVQTSVAAVVA